MIKNEKTKKIIIDDLNEAIGLIKINRFNIKKLFFEDNIKSIVVWNVYERAQACLEDLINVIEREIVENEEETNISNTKT